ncbi:MAG TPA: hypothetical protein VHU44_09680 [Acidobacteriaceae bacterium]|jgi:hypothetical protein|nr:hypothetical protein [Acidobacteriaceae bacterium]
MATVRDLKKLLKQNRRMQLIWNEGLALFGVTMVVAVLFRHFGVLGLARPTLISFVVMAIAVKVNWRLRDRVWFWLVITAAAAYHVILIVFIPWTARWIPALVVAPILFGDLVLLLWVIIVFERWFDNGATRQRKRSL